MNIQNYCGVYWVSEWAILRIRVRIQLNMQVIQLSWTYNE